jgi:hypothetical protein
MVTEGVNEGPEADWDNEKQIQQRREQRAKEAEEAFQKRERELQEAENLAPLTAADIRGHLVSVR